MLMTSDAIVTHGALYALWSTFQLWPDAGVAGPIVLDSNGIVRQGGGIIWQDGTISTMHAGFPYEELVVRMGQARVVVSRVVLEMVLA